MRATNIARLLQGGAWQTALLGFYDLAQAVKSWRKTFCLIHPGVQIHLPPQPFSQAVEQRWQHFYTLFWPVGGK